MAIPNILDEDHTDAAAPLLRTYYRRTAAGLPEQLREVRRVSGFADRQAPPPANGSKPRPAAAAGSPGHGCISLTLGPP
ncbi:hypothetical protein [Pseudarthrobacter sulfonivorans]|uniref:hypothetical protein n=1 Tax=Pseudarthrobacter sulfonivorans TaxID=121292 RepID=UPI00278832A7|nr:hypothetical protein [Pseudarthrobacter sulfonivorans]MDP9999600.1 hypothetical protein [Pseudarthrobacter sulfonivorans]